MDTFIIALFGIICVLLIVVVLLQKGRGGGLGAAFGGLGSSAFGTRVGDVFTWVTIVLTALFLVLGILASLHFRQQYGDVAKPDFIVNPAEPFPADTTKITVQIKTQTTDARIFYTLDGTEPVDGDPSMPYREIGVPVTLTAEGTTLRARAFRRAWGPSPEQSATYRLPSATTAPAVPETQPDAAEPAIAPAASQPTTAP